jgi:AcrR family transcriptional regulator
MAEIDTNKERRCRGRPQVRCDDETRQIIFDAARHEFAANGYAATSTDMIARRAGVSTKTLYRLIPNKAALFDGMVTDRLDRFLADVNLQAVDHADIEEALYAALMACANLALDPEVVALQRMVLQETGKSSDIAPTFYRNGPAHGYRAGGLAAGAAEARGDCPRRYRRGRRHAARDGDVCTATRRDLRRPAAAAAFADRSKAAPLRKTVFAGLPGVMVSPSIA